MTTFTDIPSEPNGNARKELLQERLTEIRQRHKTMPDMETWAFSHPDDYMCIEPEYDAYD